MNAHHVHASWPGYAARRILLAAGGTDGRAAGRRAAGNRARRHGVNACAPPWQRILCWLFGRWSRRSERGAESLTTCTALADWLASRSIAIFLPEHRVAAAGDESAPAEFAEPAGCSLAVAELAETFARHIAADAERAYLLGLVHLGAAWLTETAAGDEPSPPVEAALPRLARRYSRRTVRVLRSEQRPEVTCVHRAMELACSKVADEWRAMACDAGYWIGRWAVLGQAWGRSGGWAHRLAAILGRLAALEELQQDFRPRVWKRPSSKPSKSSPTAPATRSTIRWPTFRPEPKRCWPTSAIPSGGACWRRSTRRRFGRTR